MFYIHFLFIHALTYFPSALAVNCKFDRYTVKIIKKKF